MSDKDYDSAVGPPSAIPKFFGGAGNDKMELEFLFRSPKVYGYGGTGDDKIIYPHNVFSRIAG